MSDIDTRIERLLDQLEEPGLTPGQIDKIERKIRLLNKQKVSKS